MIWVELLDRHGQVTARTRWDALPVTFGRGYAGDVVIDDRHVDAVHARLVRDEQGALVLEDAGSLNGIVTAAGARAARVVVTGPTVVHLGQTAVRLVPMDAPVAAAVPLPSAARGVVALVMAPRAAVLIAVAGLAAAATDIWLGDPEANAWRQALGGALAVAVAVAVWAGGWALGGRAHGQRPAFLAHFAAAWLALLALDLAGLVFDTAAFVLDLEALAVAGGAVTGALCLTALIAVHLALAGGMSARRRLIVAASVVAAMAGVGTLIGEAAKGEFEPDEVTIRAAVEPVPAGIVRARDLDAFLGETVTLQRAVDALAREE